MDRNGKNGIAFLQNGTGIEKPKPLSLSLGKEKENPRVLLAVCDGNRKSQVLFQTFWMGTGNKKYDYSNNYGIKITPKSFKSLEIEYILPSVSHFFFTKANHKKTI